MPNDTVNTSSVETLVDMLLMIWNWRYRNEVVVISALVTIVCILAATIYKNRVDEMELIKSLKNCQIQLLIHPPQNSDDYISRFASDFDLLEVLGRGGFGVVFKAKHKVDEQHYAVKRIALPNSEGAKDKVLREAKTLAELDHVGIVRYFHAWIESPPPGWQEEKDQLLESGESMTSMTQYTKSSSPTNINNHTELGSEDSINNVDESRWGVEDRSGQFFKHESETNDLDEDSGSFSVGIEAPTPHADLSDDSVEIEFCDSNRSHSLNKVQESSPVHFTKDNHEETPNEHKCKFYLYIQMQLCKRETLKDWLSAHTPNRDRHRVLDFFYQIVSAIEYVHGRGLMHRDLKPSNIFFSLYDVVKIGDFGLVTTFTEDQDETMYGGNLYKKHTAQVGTQLYMSPEQTDEYYSQKVDIYSLGVILFELIYPFGTQMERVKTLTEVRKLIFPDKFTREMPKEAEYVKKMLSQSPDKRPSAKEILRSELLKNMTRHRNIHPCQDGDILF